MMVRLLYPRREMEVRLGMMLETITAFPSPLVSEVSVLQLTVK